MTADQDSRQALIDGIHAAVDGRRDEVVVVLSYAMFHLTVAQLAELLDLLQLHKRDTRSVFYNGEYVGETDSADTDTI
jgi:hypothetical protein